MMKGDTTATEFFSCTVMGAFLPPKKKASPMTKGKKKTYPSCMSETNAESEKSPNKRIESDFPEKQEKVA